MEPAPSDKPYMRADSSMPELTIKALALGLLMAGDQGVC